MSKIHRYWEVNLFYLHLPALNELCEKIDYLESITPASTAKDFANEIKYGKRLSNALLKFFVLAK